MDSILIVSNTGSTLQIISRLLQAQSFSRVATVQNSCEGRRCLLEADFDLIIIDAPLGNEYGDDFALHAAETTSAGIILIAPCDRLDDMNLIVEDAGIFVVPKPLSADFFYQSVKLLTASRKRVMKLQNENEKLQHKMQEVRLIDRAKCILIQYLKMTEPQAHRYIEKQAMDLRQSRIVTAENILRTYER